MFNERFKRLKLVAGLSVLSLSTTLSMADESTLFAPIAKGTALVVADQNEELQTLMRASGHHDQLESNITYANFLGGPAILEAFRAGALDLAVVGNTPPIQAHAAGEEIRIVAAVTSSAVDYSLAIRPGLDISTLEDLNGKRITYAEGTGRQPFVLNALKEAELSTSDVELIPLRVSDFPDAVRGGQVDVAVLNEPHYSRYLSDYADRDISILPDSEHARLPRALSYLYASGEALADPNKAAAINDFVTHWIAAKRWSHDDSDQWIDAYYVSLQRLTVEDGRTIVEAEGELSFPLLSELLEYQQDLVDIIYEAGDLPQRLDATEQFDLRFDTTVAAANLEQGS